MKIGIIGGLGTEITAKFYLDFINKLNDNEFNLNPYIWIFSLKIPHDLDRRINEGKLNEQDKFFLMQQINNGLNSMNEIGIDLLCIPCNTLHIFSKVIKEKFNGEFLNMIDLSLSQITANSTTGVLSTGETKINGLYTKGVRNYKNFIEPDDEEQEYLNKLIWTITYDESVDNLLIPINWMLDKWYILGCRQVILGCTDLELIVNKLNPKIEYISSYQVLRNELVKKMINVYDH